VGVASNVIKDRIELAFLAIGGRENPPCECDPSVNHVPCQTCAIYDALVSAEELLKAVGKMSHRRCHGCGHVGYYLDSTIPNCLCEKCGSADTRLIKSRAEDMRN
jgi:Zn finger protein HypA/HybF involved in hydrogenase expression